MAWYAQTDYDIRFEWGLAGAEHLSREADTAIVVDVLSFSTCVDVGVAAGAEIYPYYFKDERAREYADRLEASCASTIRSKTEPSLSPSSLQSLKAGEKIVLPSPNGSTISFSLATGTVFCGCLRNARAVAEAAQRTGGSILVVGAGEQWGEGILRPCLEDLIGAGAILSQLKGSRSPEAEAAIQAFQHFKGDLRSALQRSSSGRELIERGFPEDILLASVLDASETAPVLRDKAFRRQKP